MIWVILEKKNDKTKIKLERHIYGTEGFPCFAYILT